MSKNSKTFLAWTDYPIVGDDSVKQVEVIQYDRNKYALTRWGDEFESIKAGYLFQDKALTRRLTAPMLYALPAYEEDTEHTRLQVCETLHQEKRRRTRYIAWIGKTKKIESSSLHEILRKLAPVLLKENCQLMREKRQGYGLITETLIDSEDGFFSRYVNRKNQTVLKSRHLKALGVY